MDSIICDYLKDIRGHVFFLHLLVISLGVSCVAFFVKVISKLDRITTILDDALNPKDVEKPNSDTEPKKYVITKED